MGPLCVPASPPHEAAHPHSSFVKELCHPLLDEDTEFGWGVRNVPQMALLVTGPQFLPSPA